MVQSPTLVHLSTQPNASGAYALQGPRAHLSSSHAVFLTRSSIVSDSDNDPRRMVQYSPDDIANVVLRLYVSLNFRPPQNQFTILAAFVLSDATDALKVISIGTGSKCLPAIRLQHGGDALHDSHAEVIARRGAVRWLLEEVNRMNASDEASRWLEQTQDGRLKLAEGVQLHLYVSTVPCKVSPIILLLSSIH